MAGFYLSITFFNDLLSLSRVNESEIKKVVEKLTATFKYIHTGKPLSTFAPITYSVPACCHPASCYYYYYYCRCSAFPHLAELCLQNGSGYK